MSTVAPEAGRIREWIADQFRQFTAQINEAAVKAAILKALDMASTAAVATLTPLDDFACRVARWVVEKEWATIWAWGKRLMPAPEPTPDPIPAPLPVAAAVDEYADWSDEDMGQRVDGVIRDAIVAMAA